MAQLLYFGRLADITGHLKETRALPDAVHDTQTLRNWVDRLHGGEGLLKDISIRIALNNEIVAEPAPVHDTDEIAFMPPVGGG